MIQKTFEASSNNLTEKITQLRADGWNIIAVITKTSEPTGPDAHGVSYGGSSIEILCEKGYEKPEILAKDNPNYPFAPSRPCNPPRPGGR